MPYILSNAREELAPVYSSRVPNNAGELNYAITMLCKYYMARGETYQHYNDVIGALESAKMEFYRRVVIPYEDKKIEENGDVY